MPDMDYISARVHAMKGRLLPPGAYEELLLAPDPAALAEALPALGRLYYQAGRMDESIDAYRQALDEAFRRTIGWLAFAGYPVTTAALAAIGDGGDHDVR